MRIFVNPNENTFTVYDSTGKSVYEGRGAHEKWLGGFGLSPSQFLGMSDDDAYAVISGNAGREGGWSGFAANMKRACRV